MSFKRAINAYGKQITASFTCGGKLYEDSQIASMKRHYDGALLKSVMRCMDIQLDGETSLKVLNATEDSAIAGVGIAGLAIVGTGEVEATGYPEITARFGVKAPDETEYSYTDLGDYIVKAVSFDDDTQSLNLECYDLMLRSMIPYDLALDYSGGIPVKGLLDAICERLGWTPGYDTFTNSDVIVDEEKYDSSYTFRDVLDEISQVAAGTIAFKNGTLQVLYPNETGEIIDASNLRTLNIGEKYGPINSVVLARTPQEDNIYKKDAASVDEHGLTEIKIENNQIMDSHREDFIEGIFDRLSGLEFYLYDLDSFGIVYLDLCDRFTLNTLEGDSYGTVMLSDNLEITTSLAETSALEAPEPTETDYAAASETDRRLNKTILRVDKQAQEISALVSRTETVEGDVNGLTQEVTRIAGLVIDEDSVDIKISEAISGIDSVETSTGYTFDEDGLKISKSDSDMENTIDNTGMYVKYKGENRLEATGNGVVTSRLEAKQYLIVDGRSRFESYTDTNGGSRTACFWIGG